MEFFYRVRPAGDRWEVCLGIPQSSFVYDTLAEARQVARGAAKLHWETRGEPSGVLIELPERDPELDCRYGSSAPR